MSRARIANVAAGRAGEHRAEARERVGWRKATVRLHEGDVDLADAVVEARDERVEVLADLWCEVRVGRRGVAARYEANHRQSAAGARHLLEAELGRQLRDGILVLLEGVRVHQRDGERLDPLVAQNEELLAQQLQIGLPLDEHLLARHSSRAPEALLARLALCEPHPLVHLDDLVVQHARAPDAQVKDVWARLSANVQQVSEAPAHEQRRLCSIPLEQSVGGDGGAHPDGEDATRVQGCLARVRDARRLL
mmetsp:Transcript_1772/g.5568  ORF Transcript_1772/g.5568 Transcript_1772/m.5568 type:complete len:250 (+) Transcript_1772:1819-2568(+)